MTGREEPQSQPSERHQSPVVRMGGWPTLHVHRLITNRHIREQIHGAGASGQFNNRLAVAITRAVGTMWAAYLFVLISLVSFPQALSAFLSGDTLTGITWLSQSFLQLVLLPIIIVGQNIQGQAADKRAEQTYSDAEAILHEAQQIQEHLSMQDAQLQAQEQRLTEIIAALQQAYPGAVQGTTPAGGD